MTDHYVEYNVNRDYENLGLPKEGDALIVSDAEFIRSMFRTSRVFRIGGDEFAVIARGEDYVLIDDIVADVAAHNRQSLTDGSVVVACGMARFAGEERVSDVFERADHAMYHDKNELKSLSGD